MIAIAADSETKVKDFLIKHPMQIPVAVIGAEAITLSKALGNLVGGLPFTLVLDSKSEVVQRRAGQIKPADIDNWLRIT